MATPRAQLIDQEHAAAYHLTSRCVRRSWLCGTDPLTGRNFDHRKKWIEERLLRLASAFAVDLFGYAIMSNHLHLIIRYDPTAAADWTDAEVAERWLNSCAAVNFKAIDVVDQKDILRTKLLGNPLALAKLRDTLGSLSMFMKHLKQPIASRANREDNCKGHFFEGRFYSGALLDETALINAMAYVDLNPVRAGMVRRAIEATHTSLKLRLDSAAGNEQRLQQYLAPVVSGLSRGKDSEPVTLSITLASYLEQVERFTHQNGKPVDEEALWFQRVAMFKRKQRGYGPAKLLKSWAADRGWSRVGVATP